MEINVEKFNLELEDYFKLPESDKKEITSIIVEIYSNVLDTEPMFIHRYIDLINLSIKVSEEKEEYERADIMKRVKKVLMSKYKNVQHNP